MNTTGFISGRPIKKVNGTRTVNMQNCSALYWVFTPPTTGKNLFVSSDNLQPDPTEEWLLILIDAEAQSYRIQNVGNSKYAWVPDSDNLTAGTKVTLSATSRLFIITDEGSGQYKISPKGKDSLYWTVSGSDLNAPVTVQEDQGDASTFRFRTN